MNKPFVLFVLQNAWRRGAVVDGYERVGDDWERVS